MFSLSKHFTFDAAHRLQDHDGKCKRLHGHTYSVDVIVEGQDLIEAGPARGMLVDFGALKNIVKPYVDMIDHRTLLEQGDPLVKSLPVGDVVLFDFPPTAENLARWFGILLQDALLGLIVVVTVWETSDSSATWSYTPPEADEFGPYA